MSLISDAGTPLLSDPGRILLNECLIREIKIVPIPGVSSISTAMSVSGFSDKFLFYGFLPKKLNELAKVLDVLSTYEKEMQINNAVLAQAEADAPKAGYNTKQFYTLQVDQFGKPELVTTDINTLDASTSNMLADRVNQTPERSGYSGYLLGDGIAPNGETFGHGSGFPTTQVKGDYFLRTDFMPNRLFRYDGQRWTKMEDAVRLTMTNTDTRNNQKGTFINNSTTANIGGETVKERQPLSKALKPKADN